MSALDYFSLNGPVPVLGGAGTGSRRQIQLFIGVLLGALSKVLYDSLLAGAAPRWEAAAIAIIASVVVFPQLYYVGGLDKRPISFAHWTLAFQNGFFWSIALDRLVASISSG
jgi:hypothetical protein